MSGRLGARLIHASAILDKGYRLFNRVRSATVLRWAGESTLRAYGELAYGRTEDYLPQSSLFNKSLYRWEDEAVGRFFPAPPARVLIGGAGGGREALVLAERGYQVVGFEPARPLADALHRASQRAGGVEVWLGRYETLPEVEALDAGKGKADLGALGRFDAAIFGWASFSHIRRELDRLNALRAVGSVTSGPILASFYLASSAPAGKMGPRRLARLLGEHEQEQFALNTGYYHTFRPDEVRSLAERAGLGVAYFCPGDRDGAWPHVVLVPAGAPVAGRTSR